MRVAFGSPTRVIVIGRPSTECPLTAAATHWYESAFAFRALVMELLPGG